jgi:Meiotically up-regulated gene 113
MSYVYVMRSGPYFKIGFTGGDPRDRLRSIQTSCPLPVYLLGAIPGTQQDERWLHKVFADKRSQGEWFTLAWDDVDTILAASFVMPPEPEAHVVPAPAETPVVVVKAGRWVISDCLSVWPEYCAELKLRTLFNSLLAMRGEHWSALWSGNRMKGVRELRYLLRDWDIDPHRIKSEDGYVAGYWRHPFEDIALAAKASS